MAENDKQVGFKNEALLVNWWTMPDESTADLLRIDILLGNGMNWVAGIGIQNPDKNPNQNSNSDANKEKTGLSPNNLNPKEIEIEIKKMLTFEFIHTFFDRKQDPNYTLLNWALYGNFKDQVELIEN